MSGTIFSSIDGSHNKDISYFDREVTVLTELLTPFAKPQFQQWFDEAADYYGIPRVTVSLITSWEQFAIDFELVNNRILAHMLDVERKGGNKIEDEHMSDASNLLMCVHVVEKHLPDNLKTNTQIESVIRNSSMRFGPNRETNLQLFNDNVPFEYLPMVHWVAHTVYNLLYNNTRREHQQIQTEFGAVESRNDRLMRLQNRWDLCAVLPTIRTHEDQSKNPINLSLENESPDNISYLLCLYYVNDDDLEKLFMEMSAKVAVDYDKTSLKDLNAKLTITSDVCKPLVNVAKISFGTGYYKNAFSPHAVVRFINSPLIARALLDLQASKGRNDYVSQGLSELDFMSRYKSIETLLEICNNLQFFMDGKMLGYVPRLRKTSKLRETLPQPDVGRHLQIIIQNRVGIFASFLKEEQYNVRLVIDKIEGRKRKPILRNIESAKVVGDKRKGEDDSEILIYMESQTAVERETDAPKRAVRLQEIQDLLTRAQEIIVSQMPTLQQINSNTEATRNRIAENASAALEYLRGLRTGAGGVVSSAFNGARGAVSSAFNSAGGIVGSIMPNYGADPAFRFESRYPGGSNATFQPTASVSIAAASAGGGTPASVVRNPRGNDRSRKETSIEPLGKTGGGSQKLQMSSFAPPAPVRVVPTSQIEYNRVYGGIRAPISHVPSNVPAITFTPPYGQPVGGGSRMPLYIQNPNQQPVGGGSMASSSIDPNNVMGGTSPFTSQFRSTEGFVPDPYYGRESLATTPASSRASSPTNRGNKNNSIQSSKRGGKPRHSMSKNKKTLRRNPRKLISRRQKYSRRK